MGNVSEIDPQEISGHVDHFTEFEGDVALGTELDLAAVSEGSEGVLLAAFALEPVVVVLSNAVLYHQHQSVGYCRQHVLPAVGTHCH